MASSLDPNNFPVESAHRALKHASRSLGPSDSSDSGSDLAGRGLLDEDEVLALDRDPGEEDGDAADAEREALDDQEDAGAEPEEELDEDER